MNFIINQKNARETTKTATLSNYKKISSCGRYKPFDTELRRNFTAMFHVHLCLFKHIHSFVLRRKRDSWFFHPRNCGKLLLHLPINFYKWKLQLRWSRKNLRFKYQINSEILIFVINFLMNSVLIKVKYNYWSYFTTFPLVASFLFPARSRLLSVIQKLLIILIRDSSSTLPNDFLAAAPNQFLLAIIFQSLELFELFSIIIITNWEARDNTLRKIGSCTNSINLRWFKSKVFWSESW